uniref:Uncharacterized protein n=1 Tax=Triticum urartu TaxID=4572 RepID=A0A8R7PW42_TRIUA
MRRSGDADVVLVLGGRDAVEHTGEEQAGHEVVDAVRREAVVVEGEVEPGGQEGDVAEREEGVDRRDGGLADGEVVLGAVGVGVVHVGAYLHGDCGLGRAVGEEEAVLVGVGDGEGLAVVAGGVEVAEGEERDDVAAVEDAARVGVGVGVQIRGRRLLVDGLEEGLVGEEEEAELRGLRLGELGDGLGAGERDGDGPAVREAELLEEDGPAGVVLEGLLLDLRRGRAEDGPGHREEQEQAARGIGGRHRGEIWVGGGGGGAGSWRCAYWPD